MTVLRPASYTGRAIVPPSMNSFEHQYNYRPTAKTLRPSYLQEAEKEYIRMLDEAVEEVKQLIEEVNKLSTVFD